ncbi:MAG: hypothetical protein ACKOOL_01910 [Novosphingobium sp.]
MSEKEKPFLCYRGGGGIKIVPRGAAGWRAFGLWMLALLVFSALWVMTIIQPMSGATFAWLTGGYVALTLVWAVIMIRWMMARSEMVDMNELLSLKRELDEQKRRGRR